MRKLHQNIDAGIAPQGASISDLGLYIGAIGGGWTGGGAWYIGAGAGDA